ncbi:hypothetical protein BB559_002526 [Furculomyces boomerangus]|uniref:Uncharacterized protein n=1 Tax=Furculomyces boomerangus TaxID=61424 RepID=A0A2T9YUP4_9FUNG|nr:hypothetical protein BB559_002526 [Furculomyces boomerangus]
MVKRKKIRDFIYPYNLGIKKNFQVVLGPSLFLFWFPQDPAGDGLDFDINPGLVPPVYWPPPEYHSEYTNPKLSEDKHSPSDRNSFKIPNSSINIRNDPYEYQSTSNIKSNGSGFLNDSNSYNDQSEGPSSSIESRPDSDADPYNTDQFFKIESVDKPEYSTGVRNNGARFRNNTREGYQIYGNSVINYGYSPKERIVDSGSFTNESKFINFHQGDISDEDEPLINVAYKLRKEKVM